MRIFVNNSEGILRAMKELGLVPKLPEAHQYIEVYYTKDGEKATFHLGNKFVEDPKGYEVN